VRDLDGETHPGEAPGQRRGQRDLVLDQKDPHPRHATGAAATTGSALSGRSPGAGHPVPVSQQLTRPRAEPGAPLPRRRRRRRVLALAVTAALLAVPATSYAQALTYPGSAPFSVRSVEWVRDHGGSPVVDAVENAWYSHHVPSGAVPVVRPAPAPRAVVAARPAPAPVPAPVRTSVPPGAAGEGVWVPGRSAPDGAPALFTTFFHPDPDHPGVVAGAAWVRDGAYAAHLVAGTREPGGAPWPGGASVAPDDRSRLLATFNAGFKFKDTPGGFLLDGRTSRALVPGLATAVVDDTGRLRVGTLGADVQLTPQVLGARQNLHLVVEGGSRAPGLETNADGRWGTAKNQAQFTWRSALGTDAAGDLVYVAGNGLDLVHLADALVDAGAVQGMELDMHRGMVSFSSWAPGDPVTGPAPTKLLPDMTRPAARYLVADQRDFFYLTTPAG